MLQECLSKIVSVSVAVLAFVLLLSACQQSGGNPGTPTSATSLGQTGVAVQGHLVTYTPSSAYKPLLTCNLGMVNATIFGAQAEELEVGTVNTFKGWLFTTNLDNPTYWLRFDEQRGDRYLQSPLQLNIERPDVVAAHPNAPRTSGFAVTIPANELPPGRYHAYLAVKSGDTTYICDNGRHIHIQ